MRTNNLPPHQGTRREVSPCLRKSCFQNSHCKDENSPQDTGHQSRARADLEQSLQMANSSACCPPAPCVDPACSFGLSMCAVEPGKGRRYTSKLDTDHTHRNKSPHFQREQRWHPGTLWECTFLLLADSVAPPTPPPAPQSWLGEEPSGEAGSTSCLTLCLFCSGPAQVPSPAPSPEEQAGLLSPGHSPVAEVRAQGSLSGTELIGTLSGYSKSSF